MADLLAAVLPTRSEKAAFDILCKYASRTNNIYQLYHIENVKYVETLTYNLTLVSENGLHKSNLHFQICTSNCFQLTLT